MYSSIVLTYLWWKVDKELHIHTVLMLPSQAAMEKSAQIFKYGDKKITWGEVIPSLGDGHG